MHDTIEQKLSAMPAAKLVKIVQAVLAAMEESEQISFIAKYIDAKTSLNRLGADDSAAFMDEVEAFCLSCLNCEYYSDEDDIEEYFSNNRYNSSYTREKHKMKRFKQTKYDNYEKAESFR